MCVGDFEVEKRTGFFFLFSFFYIDGDGEEVNCVQVGRWVGS